MIRASGQPVMTLRLAGDAPATQRVVAKPVEIAATDPRWLLAVRVHESLEGTMLRPEARRRLERAGRVMGLNRFQTSLIIAIVQDQARRGEGLPKAAPTLAMVPNASSDDRQMLWRIVSYVAGLLTAEITLLWLLAG